MNIEGRWRFFEMLYIMPEALCQEHCPASNPALSEYLSEYASVYLLRAIHRPLFCMGFLVKVYAFVVKGKPFRVPHGSVQLGEMFLFAAKFPAGNGSTRGTFCNERLLRN